MSSMIGYSTGISVVSSAKRVDSLHNSYKYHFIAFCQVLQIHETTGIVFTALQAYKRIIFKAFPWHIRVLVATIVPCSMYFEINRWSSDYQPAFWKKKTIHWVCDYIGPFAYTISLISSIALAAMGQIGILAGIVVACSIDQIQNYHILPLYCCHALKIVSGLASVFFSQGILSCIVSVAFLVIEVVHKIYFYLLPTQQKATYKQKLLVNTLITNKTIEDVKNNPLHIHFKPTIDGNTEDILRIFDAITWYPVQHKELLAKDPFWIKRANIKNSDSQEYILGFRRDIENLIDTLQACLDPNQKSLMELCLKIIIQCLQGYPTECLESKKTILDLAIQLRNNPIASMVHLSKIAEKCYEKIKMLSLEGQVLQLLYKRRKEIFNELFEKIFAKESTFHVIAYQNIKDYAKPFIQDAFDSHIGINFSLADQVQDVLKISMYRVCAEEEIPIEQYFCDQDKNAFYNPQHIIDWLNKEMEGSLWIAISQWGRKQGNIDLENKLVQIQTAKKHLQALQQVNGEYYCTFDHLKNIKSAEHLQKCYGFIKEDCMGSFEALKAKIPIEGSLAEFANKICLDIEQAVNAYSEMETCLISILLQMGVFQLKNIDF